MSTVCSMPASLAKLERELLADDKFVDRFARWCLTHRQIADLLTESALHHLMDQFVQTSPGLPRHTLSHLAAVGSRNRQEGDRGPSILRKLADDRWAGTIARWHGDSIAGSEQRRLRQRFLDCGLD